MHSRLIRVHQKLCHHRLVLRAIPQGKTLSAPSDGARCIGIHNAVKVNNISTNNQDVICVRLPAILSVLNLLCGREKGVSVATIEYELLRFGQCEPRQGSVFKPTMLPAVSDIDMGDGTRHRTEITEGDLDDNNSTLEDCIVIPWRYFDHTVQTAPYTDFNSIIAAYNRTECLERPFFDLVVERETPWQKKFLEEHPLGKTIVQEDLVISSTDRSDDARFTITPTSYANSLLTTLPISASFPKAIRRWDRSFRLTIVAAPQISNVTR